MKAALKGPWCLPAVLQPRLLLSLGSWAMAISSRGVASVSLLPHARSSRSLYSSGSELHLVELLAALAKGIIVTNVSTERVYLYGLKAILTETCASQSMYVFFHALHYSQS